MPDDVDVDDKYVTVPDLKRLDPWQALVFDLVAEHAPDAESEICQMFRCPSAYRRYSNFVGNRDLTDRWHAFRDERTLAAMREWCAGKHLQLAP